MRRVTVWLLVGITVVTAGCGTLTGGDASPTVTPVSVETLASAETSDPSLSPSPTPTPPTVAPGLTADRVIDYTALVDRHGEVVSNTSHTYRRQVTRSYPNGTVWRAHTTVLKRNQSVTYNRHTWTDDSGTRRTIERWRTDGRVYVARTAENGTVMRVENGTGPPGTEPGTSDGYAGMLPRVLKQLNASDVTPVSRDGRQLYRIETPETRALPPSKNVSFVGHVTPDGVFTGYRLAYRIERRDTRVDVTVRTTFEDVGSTVVSRPTWMERAPD